MNRKKKNSHKAIVIAVLLGLCFPQPVAAQEPLLQKFSIYREKNLQEKLFLHTDKSFYLAGEICWFKIYAVDAIFHRPLSISSLAYVELLDKNNKPVLQAKIGLNDAEGNGSLYLPVTIESGGYTLRAYSNWMKNAGPEYFFGKTLTVVNTRTVYKAAAKLQKEQYQVQFFPEGGNLVNGLKSRVAFKVMTGSSKAVTSSGMVLNERGDTVAYCNTAQFGMGSFFITPETGSRYRAVMLMPDGSRMMQDLPVAAAAGFVMHLASADENRLSINVQYAGPATAPGVYLFAHTRSAVKSVQESTLQNGAVQFTVDRSKLGEGISHFTVFNAGPATSL